MHNDDRHPLITVIIPTYSRATMLPRAIRSILAQTYQHFEIIVVDDNGTGEPEQIRTSDAMRAFSDDKRIHYVCHEATKGGSQSRNTGVDYGNGFFVTFLDDDDEYYPFKLERQLSYYTKRFPNNDGFINAQIAVIKQGRIVRTTRSAAGQNNLLFAAVSEKILGTPTFFMPKNLFLSVGGFSPIPKGQEWHLSVKLIENGAGFASMPDVLVKVHVHDQGSITSGYSNPARIVDGINIIYKLQCRYFFLFSRQQISEIEVNYRLALTRALSKYNLFRAVITFLSSLRFFPPRRQSIIVIILILKEVFVQSSRFWRK